MTYAVHHEGKSEQEHKAGVKAEPIGSGAGLHLKLTAEFDIVNYIVLVLWACRIQEFHGPECRSEVPQSHADRQSVAGSYFLEGGPKKPLCKPVKIKFNSQ